MFWENLCKLCDERGIKPNTVCRELGFSTATATHWKNGKIPKIDKLKMLADYFGVSTDYLLNGTTYPANAIKADPAARTHVQFWGKVSAGIGAYAEGVPVKAMAADDDDMQEGYEYAWLEVEGDSMFPDLQDGDYILVRVQDTAQSGDMVVALVDNGCETDGLAKLTMQDCHIDDGYIICGEKTAAGRNRLVPLPPGIPELSDWLRQWAETTKKKTLVGLCAQRIRDDLFYPALLDLGMIEITGHTTSGYSFPDKHHLTPHSCRHTFASMCAAAGMQPEQLQKIIGHANYQTTADIYIHNDLDTLRQAMSKLKR